MILSLPLLLSALYLTNAIDVATAVINGNRDFSFALSGTIVNAWQIGGSQLLSVEDTSGCAGILAGAETNDIAACTTGDTVYLHGSGVSNKIGRIYANCDLVHVTSHGKEILPIKAEIPLIKHGNYDNRLVMIDGTLRDIFTDEIDSRWIFCIVDCLPERIIATLLVQSGSTASTLATLKPLIGADVSLTGLCTFNDLGYRRYIGRTIRLKDISSMKVNSPPVSDPFTAPLIDSIGSFDPTEISLQNRRRVVGTVIATWDKTKLLIQDTSGKIRKIELTDESLPQYGEHIEVVGLPETDLYQINLSSAIFRLLPEKRKAFTTARETHAETLFTGDAGLRQINPAVHGRTIRLKGIVNDLPISSKASSKLSLKCGNVSIPVALSGLHHPIPGISIGCTLDITGVCVVETENWRSYASFPHTTGILLVPRRSEDVVIIAYPPWWTPPRLIAVIGTLVVFLLGIIIWNFVLKRLVDRRSRQLFKEQIARTSSELRVDERTRLAVELHDSIAQNLTGISFEIDAADRLADTDLAKMRKHLNVAATSLRSCRGELRNCLWDLRHQTLEANDMETAIRQTLEPHVANVKLSVRFNVPRERISDSSTHAILRIIRELTLNAIRHGKATSIWVAGSIEAETLKFSVRDNGIGFDPANCPGDEQGHYGLLGIRERVNTFEGTLRIESEPGKGTKATICLNTIRETKT